MNTLDSVDAASLRTGIPDFRPGDTVKVHVKVVEGNRSRIQVFQGVVIRRHGGGLRVSVTSSRLDGSGRGHPFGLGAARRRQGGR